MSGESPYVPGFFLPESDVPGGNQARQLHHLDDAGTQWKALDVHVVPQTTGEWVDQAGLEAAEMMLPDTPVV